MTSQARNDWLACEWLEADGLGGFASGTVGGIRTRRYHALLLAATTPPTGRMVLVNGLEVWLETPAGRFSLSTQRYMPDVIYPDGQDRLGSFSNYGKKRVQLAAPGVNIVSTMPMVATEDMRAYRIPVRQGALDGTSMATPFVAGAAALVWSANPAQKAADVKTKLAQTVDRLSALTAKTA